MKTDAQLGSDVIAELDWEPSANAAHVGVAVKDGVVTLAGHLETHADKQAVERAGCRACGAWVAPGANSVTCDLVAQP